MDRIERATTIRQMRLSGQTLQQIGDNIGLTRERVRQILAENYPGARTALVCEATLAEIIGCSTHRLITLREQGKVQPKKMGRILWLYDRDEVERAMLAVQRFCPHCGQPFLRGFKYCPKCSAENSRYKYPFLNEEAKKKAGERHKAWEKQNPERAKELHRRSERNYRKKLLANTEYVVISERADLPKGTVFKAVGYVNHYLVLEDGSRIGTRSVRKVVV